MSRSIPPRRIAIIGGGFSGAVLARALIAATREPLAITIIEPRSSLGGGVAYSTKEAGHLLNGPAQVFSIHADKPSHFTDWLAVHVRDNRLATQDWRDGEDVFVPRRIYGRYIESQLRRALEDAGDRVAFTHLRARATHVSFEPGHARVWLAGSSGVDADHVVLATAFPQARPPFETEALLVNPAYVSNPWDLDAYARFADADRIAIVGSGLTMLDALVSLDRHGFRGEVHVISRRGLSVWARRGNTAWPDVLDPQDLPTTARGLLRQIQSARRAVASAGADWQTLPLAIVPHAATIWKSADDKERELYLKRLRVFWEITRHRAAPPTSRLADAWRAAGRLRTRAAHIHAATATPDGEITLDLRWRGDTSPREVGFDGLINCLGAEYDVRRAAERDGLLANLLKGGAIRSGPMWLGIDARQDGGVIGRNGFNPRLSAIGPLLRGVHWESNAIPEILPQVAVLAKRLSANEERRRDVA